MAVTGTPRMVTDGLVLHFDAANVKSYVSGSTTWTDLSPTVATASLLNGPVYRDIANGSIWFDSTNDYVVSTLTDNYQQFTVGVWVYAVPSTALGVAQEIVSKRYFFAFQTNDWPTALQINVSGSNATTGSCSFFVSNGTAYSINEGVNGRSLNNVSGVTANAWNYIVGSYNGSLVKLYVNGTLRASGSYSGTVATGNTFPWTFGRPNAWGPYGGTGYYYMTGSLAIASIYNRGLTDAEVLQNFEATRERFGV